MIKGFALLWVMRILKQTSWQIYMMLMPFIMEDDNTRRQMRMILYLLGLLCHVGGVSKVCLDGLIITRYMMVRHAVLLAQLLHVRSQLRQMAVIDIWKQMVLNLVVQATRKIVTEQTAVAKVLCSLYLVLVKVSITYMSTLVCQMIDLRVDHEANTHNDTGDCGPDTCFPKR